MATSESEKVEYIQEHIYEALHEGVEERWNATLAEWNGPRAQIKAVRAHVVGLRNRAWNALQEITSVEELERGLIVQYLELKSRWTMLNVQIQHQTRQEDGAADNLLYRATCLSLLIEALEPLLTQERVDALAEMLSEPIEERDDS